ncbi:MAG TPA: hypothetical protein VM940_09080 [Chthoniobacterales bacterium]|jgi:hypothetical protein|nr:hypothetical protein [Chthoniobacterales bacterium]
MKILAGAVMFTLATVAAPAAEEPARTLPPIAVDLWKASGGDNWSKIRQIEFTFVVEQDGKQIFAAQHHWDVAAGTDRVKWKDKQGQDHDVTATLSKPVQAGEEKDAYARWVNDSYWLLAPLKLQDPGVKVEAGGPKDLNGTTLETINLSFDKVGLTPTDRYVFYIDPQTRLPRAWDYIPQSGTGLQATWEKFQNFGGVNLATEHHFNNKTIRLTDVKVTTAE